MGNPRIRNSKNCIFPCEMHSTVSASREIAGNARLSRDEIQAVAIIDVYGSVTACVTRSLSDVNHIQESGAVSKKR